MDGNSVIFAIGAFVVLVVLIDVIKVIWYAVKGVKKVKACFPHKEKKDA